MSNENKPLNEHVIEIICKYSNNQNIDPQTDLRHELGLNSLQVIFLIVEIEDTFGVTVGEEKIPDFVIVQDIIDYLGKEKAG